MDDAIRAGVGVSVSAPYFDRLQLTLGGSCGVDERQRFRRRAHVGAAGDVTERAFIGAGVIHAHVGVERGKDLFVHR